MIALAGLFGQVVVSAADADVRDLGVAAPNWYDTIGAAYSLSLAGAGAWGGLFTIRLGGYSLASTGRAAFKIVRHPVGQLALAAVALGVFLTRSRWGPRVRHWFEDFGPRLDAIVEAATPLVEGVIEEYRTADATWNDAVIDISDAALLQRTAQVLAASPHPLSRTEITRRLCPDATQREKREVMAELARLLSAHPAFVQTSAREWQLGRAGIDFGREPQEVSVLTGRRAPRTWLGASTRLSER